MDYKNYDYTPGIENCSLDELAGRQSGNIQVFAEIFNDHPEDLLSTEKGRRIMASLAHDRTEINIERAELLIEKLTLQIRKRAAQITSEQKQSTKKVA